MDKARAELMARPSSEETVARYEVMQEEIRSAVTAVTPSVQWKKFNKPDVAACARPLSNTDGQENFLQRWTSEGAIAEANWPAAVDAVRSVAVRYGFAAPAVIVDRSADKQVNFVDSFGGFIEFGTGVNVVLAVKTGCHLPNARR